MSREEGMETRRRNGTEPLGRVRVRGNCKTAEKHTAAASDAVVDHAASGKEDTAGRFVEEEKYDSKAPVQWPADDDEDEKLAGALILDAEDEAAPQSIQKKHMCDVAENPCVAQASETVEGAVADVATAFTQVTFPGYSPEDVLDNCEHNTDKQVKFPCACARGKNFEVHRLRQAETGDEECRFEISENGLLARNGAPPIQAGSLQEDEQGIEDLLAAPRDNAENTGPALVAWCDDARFSNNLPPVKETGSTEHCSDDEGGAGIAVSNPSPQLVLCENSRYAEDLPPVPAENVAVIGGNDAGGRIDAEDAEQAVRDIDAEEDQRVEDGNDIPVPADDDDWEVVDLRRGEEMRRCHQCHIGRIEVTLLPCEHEFACLRCFLVLCRSAGGHFPCQTCQHVFVHIRVPPAVLQRYERRCHLCFRRGFG